MTTHQQLHFLQQKIQDLNSGIFFNLSEAVLKFPTALVNAVQVDDYGYVWFWMQKPKQRLSEFEAGFPVRLQFYRKGAAHFVQVTGNAWVVTDPEAINALPSVTESATNTNDNKVLVKVKMQQAEYHETLTAQAASWWQNAVQTLVAWFRTSGSYPASGAFSTAA